MIWEQREDKSKIFLEKLNNFIHLSNLFVNILVRKLINYLVVQVIVREGKLITDLHIKQTDSHQYFDFSSCNPYHCTL